MPQAFDGNQDPSHKPRRMWCKVLPKPEPKTDESGGHISTGSDMCDNRDGIAITERQDGQQDRQAGRQRTDRQPRSLCLSFYTSSLTPQISTNEVEQQKQATQKTWRWAPVVAACAFSTRWGGSKEQG